MPDLNQHTEEELFRLVATQDDQHAFNELYTRLWKKLYAVAYSHLQDIPSCEDAVHDIFTSLWINRHKIEARDIQNYLAVSVKYIVLHKLKRAAHLQQLLKSHSHIPLAQEIPSAQYDYNRILRLLKEETEKLPEKCRLVFQYSHEQGLTVKQIADKMNISSFTAKNQLAKAMKRIREGLKKNLLFFITW